MADYTVKIDAKDNASGTINKISGGLGGLTAGAGKFKAAIGIAAGAFAALGVVNVIGDKINEFDDLAKAARTAGAAASNDAFKGFQVMKQAMNEAGIDAGTFDRAMLQTTSRLKAGTEGQKSFAKITDKLGDSLLDMNGNLKSGPDLLKEMMNALNAGTISTEEFAKVVGGRAGPLIQQQFASLNTSAEALEGTLADVAANSNIVDLDAAKNAEVFNDNIGRLKEGMGQLMTDAITPLMPHLVKLSEDIMANMPMIIEKVQNAFKALEPVFSLIGTVLTDLVFPVLSKVFGVLGTIAEAISPLVESAIPGLKMAFDMLVKVVESIVGFFQGVATSLQGIYDKAIQLKDGVTGTFSNMADSVKDTTKGMTDSVTGFFGGMYQKVVGGSIVPDMVNGVIAEFKRQQTGVTQISAATANSVTTDFQNMATSVEEDFVKTLESALSDGKITMSDFSGFFSNTISSMLSDALRGGKGISGIFGSLFGGGGGGGGGLGGMLGGLFGGGGGGLMSMFGGFFADGGKLGAGKFGIAGENGAEIIHGPANITPMDQIGGGGPQVNITIQSIDTQTGTEFLLKNKKQIEGIIQNAYNKRGRQGIV